MPIPHGRQARPQPGPSSFPAIPTAADCLPRPYRPRCLFCVGFVAIMLLGSDMARAEPASAPVGSVAVFVAEAGQRFGIPASWIRVVMRAESGGDAHARSPKGAMGLMQIMPETWAALRSRYGLGADPYDAHDNVLAGAAYLRELHDRYGNPGFLAAYNAGPARYEDHLATGRPLPAETQAYLATLAPLIDGASVGGGVVVDVAARSWTDAPLFVLPAESGTPKSRAASTGQPAIDNTATDWTALAPQAGGLFVSIHAVPERVP
jgi:Transglycosylase SLT domain